MAGTFDGAWLRKIAVGLGFLLMSDPSAGHIGSDGYVFKWHEITDGELANIDLHDGSVEDWPEFPVDNYPSLTRPGHLFADPTVGEGAQWDPGDSDVKIHIGWHEGSRRIYVAMERTDNIYINEYSFADSAGAMGRHDSSIEFMLDADHSGGEYGFHGDCCDPQNQSAQRYFAIAEAPDGVHVRYAGDGAVWLNDARYMGGGGGRQGNKTVTEFYITPFNRLSVESESDSQVADLVHANILGFNIHIPDYDSAPGEVHAFFSTTGQINTQRFSSRFLDAQLIGDWNPAHEGCDVFYCSGDSTSTAVPTAAWSRIKENFTK